MDSSGNRLWVPVDNDVDQSANLYQRSSRQNSRNIDSDYWWNDGHDNDREYFLSKQPI